MQVFKLVTVCICVLFFFIMFVPHVDSFFPPISINFKKYIWKNIRGFISIATRNKLIRNVDCKDIFPEIQEDSAIPD